MLNLLVQCERVWQFSDVELISDWICILRETIMKFISLDVVDLLVGVELLRRVLLRCLLMLRWFN